MQDLSNTDKLDIIDENLRRLNVLLYDANLNKMVSEKCGEAKKMEAALKRATGLEREIAALQEIRATTPADPAPLDQE